MAEHRLSYTASEIDERLGKVSSLVAKINGITPDSTGNVTLPIDTSIQQNSTNPVTGGALFNELSGLAEGLIDYVEGRTPTKTSQLTNDSGFITGIPSEYITESELTAKGYATQTSVDALSNRIDNLPSGEGSSSGGGVQPDWNQNDSSAPDYIKNRPFYKETEIIFDEDVTTVIDENGGMIAYEHDSSIIDLESVQDGDLFEVIFGNMIYLYEIKKDMPFLGNFYLFIEQQAAGLDMTIEEYLELMSQYAPEIVELAVDTGEDFCVAFADTTLFLTKEAGTYHFTINKATNVKKLDSSMIDWAGGGAPSGLPEVTEEDNDKVLMVIDGKWVVGSITNGDEVAY